MKAYVRQTRSRALTAELEQHGIGECVVTGELLPRRIAIWFFVGKPRVTRSATRTRSGPRSSVLNISTRYETMQSVCRGRERRHDDRASE